jgi:hypothetical protein
MSLRRKILLWLLVIPAILVLPLAIWPVSPSDERNGIELLFLIIGLPLFILNYIEWYAPQILDEMLGKQAGKSQPSLDTNQPGLDPFTSLKGARPGWKLAALVVSALVIGVLLGAGALALSNKSATITAEPTPEMAASTLSSPKPTVETATKIPVTLIPTAVPSQPSLSLNLPTATATLQLLLETPGTSTTGVCISPTQAQFETIQSNIQALDPKNAIKLGYVFKSSDVENLWFFSAKIYGPDFAGGVTDPAVWAFSGPIESPGTVYAVNDLAFQYSDFAYGPQATPPVEMQSAGAQAVFDCASAGG